jgi:hypothetical protein
MNLEFAEVGTHRPPRGSSFPRPRRRSVKRGEAAGKRKRRLYCGARNIESAQWLRMFKLGVFTRPISSHVSCKFFRSMLMTRDRAIWSDMKWKKRSVQVGRRFGHARHINPRARQALLRVGMDEKCAGHKHGHELEWKLGGDFYVQ